MNIEALLYTKAGNLHFIKRYLKFIQSRTKKTVGEKHHILPKAKDMFPEFKNLNDNPWNEIILSDREHFIAHYMLAKAFPNSSSQSFACWKFFQNKNSKTSRQYQVINELKKNTHSLRMMGENNPFFGKHHSVETKKKCGIAALSADRKKEVTNKRRETLANLPNDVKEARKKKASEANKKFNRENPQVKIQQGLRHKEWYASLTEEERNARREKNKREKAEAWAKKPMLLCVHCGIQSKHPGNIKRFHGDNCKLAKEIV